MNININRITLLILYGVLNACSYGDRGGVAIEYPDNYVSPSLLNSANEVLEYKSMISAIGKCIEMDSKEYLTKTANSVLYSWDCGANQANQQWAMTTKGKIVSSNGFCMAIEKDSSSEALGRNVVATGCNDKDAQVWQYDELTKRIFNKSIPDLCLNIGINEFYPNGTNIQLWNCEGGTNQRWNFVPLRKVYIRNSKYNTLYISASADKDTFTLGAYPRLDNTLGAQWIVEPSDTAFRIRNVEFLSQYIHYEYLTLQFSYIQEYWHSAQWILIRKGDQSSRQFQIKSMWIPSLYMGLNEANQLTVASLAELNAGSDLWEIGENFGF